MGALGFYIHYIEVQLPEPSIFFVLYNRLPLKEKKLFPVEVDSLTLMCFGKVSKAALM